MSWEPPPRPVWVERLIAHGDAVGGADRLVGLDPDELVATALDSTGLGDFGPPTWREHYDVLLKALERESDLHLAGRLITRTEVLRSLRNRLELAVLWTADPELLEHPVVGPVFVVGTARSGTSLLHELLALDPAHRAPATWELLHPAHAGEPARTWGDRIHRFWHDVQPEYEAMHHNAGDLPNECIFATMNEFLSDHWSGVHEVPSYTLHLAQADHTDAYRYHRRILQTLGRSGRPSGREARERWLLKAPSHLATLRFLFAVYPDATIIQLHRDPLRTVPSTVSLMATLRWMRCRRTDPVAAAPFLAAGYAAMLDGVADARSAGRLPDEQFVDVRYADLVGDPLTTVADLYRRCGWDLGDETRAAMAERLAARPQGAHGTHTYALEDFGLDPVEERARFAAYRERYEMPDEP
jgi:Sulfotransferase family